MCLAGPMKVLDVAGARGVVELGGVRKEVSLDLLEDVVAGDYVIVHAGFAIEKLKPDEAQKTLDLFKELEGSAEEPEKSPPSAPPRGGGGERSLDS